MKKTYSIRTMILIAGALFIAGFAFHLPTALGQGIDENSILSWQGIYEKDSGEFFLQINYAGSPAGIYPMSSMPLSWFIPANRNRLSTTMDNPSVLDQAVRENGSQVHTLLGTHNNVSSLFVVFPAGPVSYTTAFLKQLAAMKINPSRFGGPDIPPGLVPYTKLQGGVLHIDTQINENTLTQCQPGQIPPQLALLLGKKDY